MPPPSSNQPATRYYLRRRDGTVSGPHDPAAIVALLGATAPDNGDEISVDRRAWKPARTLWAGAAAIELGGAAPPGPPVAARGPAPGAPAPEAAAGRPSRFAPLEPRGAGDPSRSFAPLQLEVGRRERDPAGPRVPAAPPAEAPPDPTGDVGLEDVSLGPTLELVERKPPPRAQPAGGAATSGPGGTPAKDARARAATELARDPAAPALEAHAPGARAGGPGDSRANAVVAALLDVGGESGAGGGADATRPVLLEDATRPVSLEGDAPTVASRAVRPRTMTAARGGPPGEAPTRPGGRRLKRPAFLVAGAVVVAGAVAAGAFVFDLPGRLRGEPAAAAVLGPAAAAAIAADRFPAFSDGARRLEDAVAGRPRAPATRAEAAMLLASSVVIHGAERGRLAQAEALLGAAAGAGGALPPRAAAADARARAWLALAKGRWKEAETIAAEAALTDGDRAVVRGWAALGRGNTGAAEAAFAEAARAEPGPAPSRVAARYGLGLAREARGAPDAAAAYRAVLTEAPAHVGAGLGLLRTSALSPAGRAKLAEALVAHQATDASRAELGEAHAILAEAARARGDDAAAEAALGRARQADPSSVTVAVAAGDARLAEGRTDEAIARYRLALAPPAATPRTPALKFARVAALVDGARAAEATAALAELDRQLPRDARVAFWRARLAERAQPPDLAAAERDYREARARDPKFLPPALDLARLLLDQRRGGEALAVLRAAEAAGVAPRALQLALGQALLGAGNAAEAARAFRQALGGEAKGARAGDAANPNANGARGTAAPTAGAATSGPSAITVAHLGLAMALEAAGDVTGARAELGAVMARADAAALGARVAAISIKLGHRDDALVAYQMEIAAGAATGATKVAAARLALELGRRDVAQQLAEAAVSDDPRTPGALLALAEVRRAAGDLPSAIAELRRARAVDGSPEVALEYGRALAALGRDEDALAALAEARDLPEAAVVRGRIDLRRGDTEAAARELALATAKLPRDADAFLLLGNAEDRLGHAPRAQGAWRTAVKLAPDLGEARYRLGRLELDRGETTAALPHLRAAADHVPADASWRADLYFQLATAEKRQGGRERAAAAFRRYLDLAPADAPARAEVTRQLGELAP